MIADRLNDGRKAEGIEYGRKIVRRRDGPAPLMDLRLYKPSVQYDQHSQHIHDLGVAELSTVLTNESIYST